MSRAVAFSAQVAAAYPTIVLFMRRRSSLQTWTVYIHEAHPISSFREIHSKSCKPQNLTPKSRVRLYTYYYLHVTIYVYATALTNTEARRMLLTWSTILLSARQFFTCVSAGAKFRTRLRDCDWQAGSTDG